MSGERVRWSEDDLSGAQLPEETRRYLIETGLPADRDGTYQIGPGTGPGSRGRFVIGADGPVPICIEADGRVVALEDPSGPPRFMNRDVAAFAELLSIYERYRRRVRDLEDDEDAAQALIDEVASAMERVDPEAMRDPEHYWPVIVEQMRDGLL